MKKDVVNTLNILYILVTYIYNKLIMKVGNGSYVDCQEFGYESVVIGTGEKDMWFRSPQASHEHVELDTILDLNKFAGVVT